MTGDISNNVSVVIRSRSFREQTKVEQYILLTVNQHCVVANVNVDGKHLTQIKKRNIQQRLPIIYCGNSVSLAGEK